MSHPLHCLSLAGGLLLAAAALASAATASAAMADRAVQEALVVAREEVDWIARIVLVKQ